MWQREVWRCQCSCCLTNSEFSDSKIIETESGHYFYYQQLIFLYYWRGACQSPGKRTDRNCYYVPLCKAYITHTHHVLPELMVMTFIVLVNFFLVICLNSSTEFLPDEFKTKSRSQQTGLKFAILRVACGGVSFHHSQNVVTPPIVTRIPCLWNKYPRGKHNTKNETHIFEEKVTFGKSDWSISLVRPIHGT